MPLALLAQHATADQRLHPLRLILTDWSLTCLQTTTEGTTIRRLPVAQIVHWELTRRQWTADLALTTSQGDRLECLGLRRHEAEVLVQEMERQRALLA